MQLSVFQLPIHSFVSIKMNAVKWLDSIGVAHIKGRAVVAFPDFCSMKKGTHSQQLAFWRLPHA